MTLYQILWFFIAYSVLGWCVEVAYHALTLGKVINRGFLNGPVCPVYGFGMLAVLIVFNTIRADMTSHYGFALFLGGMLLTTSIELIAGWGLDKLFHARWWDYSDQPFNFHGYICLKFSILWGLGTVFVYRILHPTVEAMTVGLFPILFGWAFLAIGYLTYAVDLVVSVATVRGLNRNLEELDELRKKLRIVSDSMSRQIGEGTIRTAEMMEEGRVQAELAKEELADRAALKAGELQGYMDAVRYEQSERMEALQEGRVRQAKADQEEIDRQFEEFKRRKDELTAKYEAVRSRLYQHPVFGAGRLVRAFPNAVHRDHNELLKEFRLKLEERKKNG